jgi:hypothetical protein
MSDHPPWLLKHWDSRQPAWYQASALGAMLFVTGGLIYLSFTLETVELLFMVCFFFISAGAAAYQFLSYQISLSRNKRGRLLLHKRRYLAFVPLWSITVSLAKFDTVRTDWQGPSGSMAWRILTRDQREDVFVLELYSQRTGDALTVYRGPDEETMKDLADVLREHAGLTLTRK